MCISLFLDCAGNENEQNLEGLIMVTYMESDYHFSMLRWRSDGRLLCGCTHEKSQGKELIVSVFFLFLFSPVHSLLSDFDLMMCCIRIGLKRLCRCMMKIKAHFGIERTFAECEPVNPDEYCKLPNQLLTFFLFFKKMRAFAYACPCPCPCPRTYLIYA